MWNAAAPAGVASNAQQPRGSREHGDERHRGGVAPWHHAVMRSRGLPPRTFGFI